MGHIPAASYDIDPEASLVGPTISSYRISPVSLTPLGCYRRGEAFRLGLDKSRSTKAILVLRYGACHDRQSSHALTHALLHVKIVLCLLSLFVCFLLCLMECYHA
ncbi:hypothetical protein VN97_g11161 [Penicillium thymicola]|uniref:Uncharacterized protein n=1 Tax=Penicillium thymicola TaxID=293382 RepID=A0AAI9T8A7_PENTH|nr:hypothetical protein VN97_g11161 [Penicillium thymicola]